MTRLSLVCLSVLSVAAVGFSSALLVSPATDPLIDVAAPAADPLRGLWTRWPTRQGTGEPIRFYYFHGDGHGLYRYGRVGLTHTHSFDYRHEGDLLVVRFRKTGKEHQLSFSLETGDRGERILQLHGDPEEAGEAVRYTLVPTEGPRDQSVFVSTTSALPAGRMWLHLSQYATGGAGFALYQMAPSGIDGRGTGWFHRGDFDDWSTESLTYRLHGDTLELHFELTGERSQTRFTLSRSADDETELRLDEDPRNFWHRATFVDMGRSFAIPGQVSEFWGLQNLHRAHESLGAKGTKGD